MTPAEKVIAFIEKYCVVPEGTKVGRPLVLAEFQKRFIREIYDNPAGATRRAYLAIARKNGKTGLIASIVLAHLVGPMALQNSQIVSGARSRDQASLVFSLASKMIQLNPDLAKLVRIIPSGKRLIGLARNVEYRALAADGTTAHGLSPVLAILDEVGQIKGPQDDFVDAITTAQGAYENPLLIAISTQAPTDADLFSIWLDGAAASDDPRVVSHVYTAPEDCVLDDEVAWKAANPALDLFRSRNDLAEQAARAKEMPSAQNTFRVLCLNQRVNMFSPLIGKDKWFSCQGDATIVPGEDVYLALDLSSVDDLTALVMVSADDGDRVQAFIWKPEDVLERHGTRDNVDYRAWHDAGHLLTSPGGTIDPAVVAMKIADLMGAYNVLGLCYDRWRIDALIKELDRIDIETHKEDGGPGLKLIDWGQGYASMAPAIDVFERSVLERTLVHPGNPVLSWNVANAVVTQDPAGNRKLDKSKARFRIDGAVALSMVLGLKARDRSSDESSVYTGERGLLFV